MSDIQSSYIKNPKVMYKFGYTDMGDANQRFSEATARIRNFRGVALGRDYDARTRWSIWVKTKEDALAFEEMFKSLLPPKNIWTDETYNGITECRALESKEAEALITELKEKYKKSEYSYSPGYYKVYFVMFVKK